MTAATDQFQRWLDQGYIDAVGFAPASDHQSAVSKRYGLSLGTVGDEDARPGGGGLAFSREAPRGRDYRWEVNSPEDILRFMEFANEMAPHTMDRQASFGIPQYTGQDVYDFFIRPQEVARMDAARKGLHGSLDRGRRMAASEGAKLASSMFGGGATAGGELEARAGRTLADMGGSSAERALIEGLGGITAGIKGDPTRLRALDRLSDKAMLGHGIHTDLNRGVSEAFGGLSSGTSGGSDPFSQIGAAGVDLVAQPFAMGGIDQARRHQEVLARKLNLLSDVDPADWTADLPVAGTTPQQMKPFGGTFATALGDMFTQPEEQARKPGQGTFAFS